jgi:hypothetical protein
MDPGSQRGGSIKVLELIEDHPAQLAYDFRARFNLSIDDIGHSISLREASLLIAMLQAHTDSWVFAAVNGWDYPVSREWIALAHTYDLHAAVNSKQKPKPYPAPWPVEGEGRIGGKTQLSVSEVLNRLESMNQKEEHGD